MVQFAQLAAQLPEDALEDLMIAEADGNGAPNPNGGMPGQLQGELGVLDFDQDVADQDPVVEGGEGDGNDDDADIEVREGNHPSSRFPEARTLPPR